MTLSAVVSGFGPGVTCSLCKEWMHQSDYLFDQWFSHGEAPCPNCIKWFPLEDALVSELLANPTSPLNACMFGARAVDGVVTLHPGETTDLDLDQWGIPQGADIVYVGATPYHGAGWPSIVSWGRLLPIHIAGRKIPIYGRRHDTFVAGEGVPPASDVHGPRRFDFGGPGDNDEEVPFRSVMGENTLLVTIVYCAPDPSTTRNLALAAMHFQSSRPVDTIIPANVASEVSISGLVRDVCAPFTSKDHLRGFFDAVTYGHRLNVLLNVCSAVLGVPPLASSTRSALNRLRKLRNAVAHDGQLTPIPSVRELAEFLVAALLGTKYVEFCMRRRQAIAAAPPLLGYGQAWPSRE